MLRGKLVGRGREAALPPTSEEHSDTAEIDEWDRALMGGLGDGNKKGNPDKS